MYPANISKFSGYVPMLTKSTSASFRQTLRQLLTQGNIKSDWLTQGNTKSDWFMVHNCRRQHFRSSANITSKNYQWSPKVARGNFPPTVKTVPGGNTDGPREATCHPAIKINCDKILMLLNFILIYNKLNLGLNKNVGPTNFGN